jgi:hypothetical protein
MLEGHKNLALAWRVALEPCLPRSSSSKVEESTDLGTEGEGESTKEVRHSQKKVPAEFGSLQPAVILKQPIAYSMHYDQHLHKRRS